MTATTTVNHTRGNPADPKTRRSHRSLLLPHVCIEQLTRHREQQALERVERVGRHVR